MNTQEATEKVMLVMNKTIFALLTHHNSAKLAKQIYGLTNEEELSMLASSVAETHGDENVEYAAARVKQ
jgi:hypothetical protein